MLPILAMALAASIVFTSDSGTRYRAPLEPLLVVLAVSCVAPLFERHRHAAAYGTRPST